MFSSFFVERNDFVEFGLVLISCFLIELIIYAFLKIRDKRKAKKEMQDDVK